MHILPFTPIKTFSLVCAILIVAHTAHASVSVTLTEPTWAFLLENQNTGDTEAQLSASESNFAKRIRPLLTANNHEAIVAAFNDRNIENDSAALRQLRGQVLLSLKQYETAEQALMSALDLLPNLALSHRSLSMLYMIKKDYAKARIHLKRSIELGVADAQVYGQLAFVNLQLGQASSAIAGYQYALFLDPDNTQWQQGLLYALIDSQAFDQAQGLIEERLKTEENNATLWLQRAQIALQLNRSNQALSSFEVAFSLGENTLENIVVAAQLHIQHGSAQRAISLLKDHMQALVAAGPSKMNVIDQISQWLVFHQYWSSLQELLLTLESHKASVSHQYRSRFDVYRAKLALHEGAEKRARIYLERSVESDPTNGEALLTLAKLLHGNKNHERAIQLYVRAQGLSEFKERALLGRSQVEIDRKMYSDALLLLRQVMQLNPTRADILGNIQSLENLVRNKS